jgi:hypothetical protein
MPSEEKIMNRAENFFSGLSLRYKFILLATVAIVAFMSIIGYLERGGKGGAPARRNARHSDH